MGKDEKVKISTLMFSRELAEAIHRNIQKNKEKETGTAKGKKKGA